MNTISQAVERKQANSQSAVEGRIHHSRCREKSEGEWLLLKLYARRVAHSDPSRLTT